MEGHTECKLRLLKNWHLQKWLVATFGTWLRNWRHSALSICCKSKSSLISASKESHVYDEHDFCVSHSFRLSTSSDIMMHCGSGQYKTLVMKETDLWLWRRQRQQTGGQVGYQVLWRQMWEIQFYKSLSVWDKQFWQSSIFWAWSCAPPLTHNPSG